jgi:hypothetical protein
MCFEMMFDVTARSDVAQQDNSNAAFLLRTDEESDGAGSSASRIRKKNE